MISPVQLFLEHKGYNYQTSTILEQKCSSLNISRAVVNEMYEIRMNNLNKFKIFCSSKNCLNIKKKKYNDGPKCFIKLC